MHIHICCLSLVWLSARCFEMLSRWHPFCITCFPWRPVCLSLRHPPVSSGLQLLLRRITSLLWCGVGSLFVSNFISRRTVKTNFTRLKFQIIFPRKTLFAFVRCNSVPRHFRSVRSSTKTFSEPVICFENPLFRWGRGDNSGRLIENWSLTIFFFFEGGGMVA